jgi:hypothetical protein
LRTRLARADWKPADVHGLVARWRAAQPELAARLDAEALAYLDYHMARYARLLAQVAAVARRAATPDGLTLLDVGPNLQTALLRTAFEGAVVDTLGFSHPAVPPREHERHIEFDLNDSPLTDRHPRPDHRYDVIVVAEVVEHLYTPLCAVLGLLGQWLRPVGFVVIQTPNGAALHKRLALLAGRNPIPPPRLSRENPGHFHEYTLSELREQVSLAGLELDSLSAESPYGAAGVVARLYRGLGHVLPSTLRHGVTLCARAGQ